MLIITHLIACEIPKSGFARLFFFTQKEDEYFWGTDNNSIMSVDIERWMKDGSVIKLRKPIEMDEKEILFIGTEDGPTIYSGTLEGSKKICGKVEDLCM